MTPVTDRTMLQLAHWRRQVAELYALVRASADPADGHELWRAGRDELFQHHPQSPLTPSDPLRRTGLPYWPYDPGLRFQVPVHAPDRDELRTVQTSGDGAIGLRLVGRVDIAPLGIGLDVWWLSQYGGGVFVPVRDGTAGDVSYGGGRYLLDTTKGADLGGDDVSLVLDFNFLYHPSCRYNSEWECPLAPPGNTTAVRLAVGERL